MIKKFFKHILFLNKEKENKEKENKKKEQPSFDISCLNPLVTPHVLLHSGEGQPGYCHIRMWAEVFEKTGIPFAILTRLPKLFDFVKKNYPHLSVALAKNPEHVEEILRSMPQLQACFYTSHTGNNIHLLRFNHIKHIFIGHGDSNKSASVHKFFRAYDEVWTAGQAHIDRFKMAGFNLGCLKFKKVGRPNLESLITGESNIPWHKRFESPRILYLPTWEGVYQEQSYSSLPLATELLSAAIKATTGTAIVKLHPQTGAKQAVYKAIEPTILEHAKINRLPVNLIGSAVPLQKVLSMGNIFICDISAAITECLAMEAPIFVYTPKDKNIVTADSAMPLERFCYTFSTPSELYDGLVNLLVNGDVFAEQRAEAQQYFLGLEETRQQKFIQELRILTNANYKEQWNIAA